MATEDDVMNHGLRELRERLGPDLAIEITAVCGLGACTQDGTVTKTVKMRESELAGWLSKKLASGMPVLMTFIGFPD